MGDRRIGFARPPVTPGQRRPGGRGRGGRDRTHAAGEVLTAPAARQPGLAEAAEVYDRAARPSRGPEVGRASGMEAGLRRTARQLLRQRRAVGDDVAASVTLAVALAGWVSEIARWHRAQDRPHQATAARRAAGVLERWSAPRRPAGGQLTLLERRRDDAVTTPRPRPEHALR